MGQKHNNPNLLHEDAFSRVVGAGYQTAPIAELWVNQIVYCWLEILIEPVCVVIHKVIIRYELVSFHQLC